MKSRHDEIDAQQRVLADLMHPAAYPHPVGEIRRIDTHISCVFLTGEFAYKVKKAVNLGFLDFTRLAQRRFFCDEELRLNRRLAPELYLDVVPISGVPARVGNSRDGAATEACEFAVKMREFPQAALFDQRLSAGDLSSAQIDALADRIAAFHAHAPRSGVGDEYGEAHWLCSLVAENIDQLRALPALAANAGSFAALDELAAWSRDEFTRIERRLAARKQQGFVRECHGDLHLANIVGLESGVQIFDCIEFEPQLRWIDVISDIGFAVMDLRARGAADLANRLLNRYLESTGDYAGLEVLPFYLVYHALVRAKVAAIQTSHDAQCGTQMLQRYLDCARALALPRKRWLVLMHGLSGSGKSTVAQNLATRCGAIRLRSDVERKRLCGLSAVTSSGRAELPEQGIYDATTTQATYQRLVQLARTVIDAGFPVVVDAASLKGWQRRIFSSQAAAQQVPFRLLCCGADEATLRARLLHRERVGDDVSDARVDLLPQQQRSLEPLSANERRTAWSVDGAGAVDAVLCPIEEELYNELA